MRGCCSLTLPGVPLYRTSGSGSCGRVVAGVGGSTMVCGAAGLVAGPSGGSRERSARPACPPLWAERAERFLRYEEGVRAGTGPPSLLDRMESWTTLLTERFETWGVLEIAYANERRISSYWPLAARAEPPSACRRG